MRTFKSNALLVTKIRTFGFYVSFRAIDYRTEIVHRSREGPIVHIQLSKMATVTAAEKNEERRKRVSVSC